MIYTGAGPIKKLQAAVQPVRGFDHVAFEILKREQARAGARHEDAAEFHERDREEIQIFVFLAAFPVAGGVARENKLRRIEHDHVPLLPVLLHLARVGEGIRVTNFSRA